MKKLSERNIRRIARVCNDANRALCITLKENSIPALWTLAPNHIRESAINGVKHVIANPNLTPRDSHESWMKFKIKDGWKYGKKKNLIDKTHPCLVQYDKLPPQQRMKDFLFIGIVKALIAGLQDGGKL